LASAGAAQTARIPLTGADCFLRAFDAEIGRLNGASHLSQLVLRLGPGFDAARLRALVRDAAEAQPILRAPIRRAFGFGAPVYDLRAAASRPPPAVDVHESGAAPAGDEAFPALFAERLNERVSLRRGELLRFDAVRYDGGVATDLAMTWAHLLFDGSGSVSSSGSMPAGAASSASTSSRARRNSRPPTRPRVPLASGGRRLARGRPGSSRWLRTPCGRWPALSVSRRRRCAGTC